jgi:hypothetical protein
MCLRTHPSVENRIAGEVDRTELELVESFWSEETHRETVERSSAALRRDPPSPHVSPDDLKSGLGRGTKG